MKINKVFAIISLIFSIIGVALCICYGVGAIFGVIAIIFGIISIKTNNGTSKNGMAIAGIAVGSLALLLGLITFAAFSLTPSNSENKSNTENNLEISSNNNELIVDKGKNKDTSIELQQKDFMDILKEKLDEETANNIYDILLNQIGFTDIVCMAQTNNEISYDLYGSGIDFVLTVEKIEDQNNITIIALNEDFIFYENGMVTGTVEDYETNLENQKNRFELYAVATDMVKATFDDTYVITFPNAEKEYQNVGYAWNKDVILIQGYADVKKEGETSRIKWIIEYKYSESEDKEYELVYSKVNGKENGKYIDLGKVRAIAP